MVQGLTEFLPVSSSGHLILVSKLFNIQSDLTYDVLLHVGTLAAVIIVYRQSIRSLFTRQNSRLLLHLFLASIPTFVIALAVKLFVPFELLEKLLPLGFALTIILLVFSHFSKQTKPKPTLVSSVVTGVVQGIAVLPGLSRSGSTISTMSFFGVRKEQCAEFSFLLSIPVILASAAVEGYQALSSPLSTSWLNIAAGVLVAGLTGIVAIKLVQKTLKKANFIGFAFYLAIPLLISLIIL